jgi:nucleoside-triphosphatase
MTRERERIGFLIRTTDGKEAILAEKGLESSHRLGEYGINCGNLDEIGVAAVREALEKKDIIVIDEIGKMELFSKKFKEVVIRALDSQKKVVGVIHTADQPFLNAIRKREDVRILEVTGENNEEIFGRIRSLLEES